MLFNAHDFLTLKIFLIVRQRPKYSKLRESLPQIQFWETVLHVFMIL